MKMVIVKGAVKFKSIDMELKALYDCSVLGVDSKGALISVKAGILQRQLQKIEWEKDNYKKVKEYLASVVKGLAAVDHFIIVPLGLVIQSIKVKIKNADPEIKPYIAKSLQEIESDFENGVRFYLIDGQNRIKNAIIPFFENEVSFGSSTLDVQIDGVDDSWSNLYYKDLDDDSKTFIDNIMVPVREGVSGDIDSFVDALIAKNEGCAWTQWQKTMAKKWWTQYREALARVAEDPLVESLFAKIKGNTYSSSKNGYELFVSEMFIWMDKKCHVGTGIEGHMPYFNGEIEISATNQRRLTSFLRNFANAYDKVKSQITHTEIRNYVMFRYFIDKPSEFSDLSSLSWDVRHEVSFASEFRVINAMLIKDPKARINITSPTGKIQSVVKPGMYPWANSNTDANFLLKRIDLLAKAFLKKKDALLSDNIISIRQDVTPSIEEIYNNNPYDAEGRKLKAVEVTPEKFDRGHKISKANGGSNSLDNYVLQDKHDNRSLGKINLPV